MRVLIMPVVNSSFRPNSPGALGAMHALPRIGLPVASAILVAGCSPAPSQNIMGSFFPSWLLCAALGAVIALLCRRLLSAAGISEYLIAAPLVYVALAASAALLIWLIRFGG